MYCAIRQERGKEVKREGAAQRQQVNKKESVAEWQCDRWGEAEEHRE